MVQSQVLTLTSKNKAKFAGEDFTKTTTEAHAGYDFGALKVQGGPAFISPDGEAGYTEYSGKVKASTKLNEDLKLYGELSFITEDRSFDLKELNYGTKVGVTYTF